MALKLNKEEGVFRNELIFTVDAKAINIDNTMVNLFMLLRHNGQRPKQRNRAGTSAVIDINVLKNVFKKMEVDGEMVGYNDHPEAGELWIRNNLVNMVSRGNVDKEKISSLRPIHLESYRVRNVPNTRDYFSADQVYLMLGCNPAVKEDLKSFLMEGWDPVTNKINASQDLDVDSLGLLHIIKNVMPGFLESNSNLNQIEPLLKEDAELYCDDVKRLLRYKTRIPRNVLIDYLKTITSFHLSRYIQKTIYLLPKMIDEGKMDVIDNWNVVLDATDSFESRISKIAATDADDMTKRIYDYIKATFQINAALRKLKKDKTNSENLRQALDTLKNKAQGFEVYFETLWDHLYHDLDEDDKELVNDLVKYESSYFDRYVEFIIKAKGAYQYKYNIQMIDNLSQKNNDRGFLAQGRSKKHPRRFMLGTRLLETFVQILVLETDGTKYTTKSMSIEDLMIKIRKRYGLIINGLGEERFQDADVNTHLAFKENVEAFKHKLRQIGFYNDLSDAYLLQKIRPRYELK